MKQETPPYSRPETYFFLAVLLVVGVLSFLVFAPFVSTLVLAATIAVVVYPVHKKILGIVKNGTVASLISVMFLLLIIVIPLFFIVAQIFSETTATYQGIQNGTDGISLSVSMIQDSVNNLISKVSPGLTIDVRHYLTNASEWILQNFGTFFSGTLSIGFNLFLGIFSLFYFLRDGKPFVDDFKKSRLLPSEYSDILIKKLRIAIQSIIGGKILVALLQGLATGIALLVFGVPNPALWGTLAGIASLVPNLGTALVIVPSVIYLFMFGNLFQAIGLGIVGLFFIGLIDNFLNPYLVGGRLNIHPLVILFSILGGIVFFGPAGFLLGPLVIALLLVLLEIYRLMVRDQEKAIE